MSRLPETIPIVPGCVQNCMTTFQTDNFRLLGPHDACAPLRLSLSLSLPLSLSLSLSLSSSRATVHHVAIGNLVKLASRSIGKSCNQLQLDISRLRSIRMAWVCSRCRTAKPEVPPGRLQRRRCPKDGQQWALGSHRRPWCRCPWLSVRVMPLL